MIHAKLRVPNFIGVPYGHVVQTWTADSLDALLAHEFFANLAAEPGFSHWAQSRGCLVAVYRKGSPHFILQDHCAWLSGEPVDLPEATRRLQE